MFSLAAKDKEGGRSRENIAYSAQTEYCTTFHCLCVCLSVYWSDISTFLNYSMIYAMKTINFLKAYHPG